MNLRAYSFLLASIILSMSCSFERNERSIVIKEELTDEIPVDPFVYNSLLSIKPVYINIPISRGEKLSKELLDLNENEEISFITNHDYQIEYIKNVILDSTMFLLYSVDFIEAPSGAFWNYIILENKINSRLYFIPTEEIIEITDEVYNKNFVCVVNYRTYGYAYIYEFDGMNFNVSFNTCITKTPVFIDNRECEHFEKDFLDIKIKDIDADEVKDVVLEGKFNKYCEGLETIDVNSESKILESYDISFYIKRVVDRPNVHKWEQVNDNLPDLFKETFLLIK